MGPHRWGKRVYARALFCFWLALLQSSRHDKSITIRKFSAFSVAHTRTCVHINRYVFVYRDRSILMYNSCSFEMLHPSWKAQDAVSEASNWHWSPWTGYQTRANTFSCGASLGWDSHMLFLMECISQTSFIDLGLLLPGLLKWSNMNLKRPAERRKDVFQSLVSKKPAD